MGYSQAWAPWTSAHWQPRVTFLGSQSVCSCPAPPALRTGAWPGEGDTAEPHTFAVAGARWLR